MVPLNLGQMRASSADRERAVDVLKAAFAEGRLDQSEYAERVDRLYRSRTYSELAALTVDLPVGPLGTMAPPRAGQYMPVAPKARGTNGMAIASLVCGCCGFPFFGLTALPALVLGLAALSSIRRTGQEGRGLAIAGTILGCLELLPVGFVLFLVLGLH
jgi:hypothetical protein